MDITTIFQVTYLIGTFAICMIVVYLPRIALTNESADFSPRSIRILDLTNFFAIGVFLATCFVMLMPHVESTFIAAFSSFHWEAETCYKLVQLVVMFGFLLVYFLEKILDHCKNSFSEVSSLNDNHHICKPHKVGSIPNYVVTFERVEEEEEDNNDEDELNREEEHLEPCIDIDEIVIESNVPHHSLNNGDDDDDDDEEDDEEEDESKLLVDENAEKLLRKERKNKIVDSKSIKNINSHYSKKMDGLKGVPPTLGSIVGQFDVRCAAMLSALCVHSLFEGVTLGLQSQLWRFLGLAGAVSIHQITAALAVGVSLVKRRLACLSFLISSLLFSASIPLGVFIGIILSNFTEVNRETEMMHAIPGSAAPKIIAACLQALTVGTFIYVIFVEIIPSELNRRKDQVFKTILLLVGFMLVACLAFFLAKS